MIQIAPKIRTVICRVAASASEWTHHHTSVPSNSGLFGSREHQRVDASPLAGARGYPANHSPNLWGDLNHTNVP